MLMSENQTEYETEAEGMTDKEFFALMDSIKAAWHEYNRLQQIYEEQTGQRYKWLK